MTPAAVGIPLVWSSSWRMVIAAKIWVRERELGQVTMDRRVEIDHAALGELADGEGGDALRHRPEQERRVGIDGAAGEIGRAEPGGVHDAIADDDDGSAGDTRVATLGVEPRVNPGIG